jgi:hypothetical protein
VWHQAENPLPGSGEWHDPAASIDVHDDMDSYIQPVDAFGAPPLTAAPRAEAITQPLPSQTRPLGKEEAQTVSRPSVWEHISQVLAGRPVEPLLEETAANNPLPPTEADRS